jgi:hypothetical protein
MILKRHRSKPCLEGRRFDKFVRWEERKEIDGRREKEEKAYAKT